MTNPHDIFRPRALSKRLNPRIRSVLLKAPFLACPSLKVPVVRQTTALDCGAACLAMVLGAFGKNVSLGQVRDNMGIQRDGTNARTIASTAERYGLRAQGVSLKLEDMNALPLPAILHWNFNHFVVLTRWKRRGGIIIDPGGGQRMLAREDFDAAFTGVALVFEPGAWFTRQEAPKREWRRYLSHLLRAKTILGKIFGLSLVFQGLGLALPLLTAVVVDKVVPHREWSTLSIVSMGLLAYVIFYGLSSLFRTLTLVYLQTRLDERMMLDFFEHLLSLPFGFFQIRSTGDLIMRLSSNSTVRQILSQQFLTLASDGLLLVGYLVLMVCYQPLFALIVVGIAVVQVFLAWLSIRIMKELVEKDVLAQSKSQSYLVEALRGIETIKVSAAESMVFDQWRRLFTSQLRISLTKQRKEALLNALVGSLNTAAPLLLLVAGAAFVLRGNLTLGTMLGFNALAGAFLSPLASLVSSAQGLQVIGTHLDRLEEVFGTLPEARKKSVQPRRLKGSIVVRDVSFRYAPHSPYVVRHADLTVEPGHMIAIVGPSGSGKTTLAKLLMGLYEPACGKVLYDGYDIMAFDLRELRQQLGIVLQGSFLFNDTVRSNIALNAPEMPFEKVRRAAEEAAISDEIEAMPMGYETLLSEMANNLSGGQRQRLCIARALAHEPKILLLDEATSELDTRTEGIIHRNLDRMNCTRVVIAHRMSTVRNADRIVVLDGGRIVEEGTHQELVSREGLYAQLAEAQSPNVAGSLER